MTAENGRREVVVSEEYDGVRLDAFLAADDESGVAARMPAAFSELTDRETEVLTLVARGLPNGQIAERLRISDKTVRNHVTNIFWKIGATSRAEAIVRAREAGIGVDAGGVA